MRAAPMTELKRLHALRQTRAELAERAVMAAQAAVRQAEAALAERDRRIVALDQAGAELEQWFAGGPEARLIETALGRRAALKDLRAAQVQAREAEAAALAEAVRVREEAVAVLGRARARLEAAALQLKAARQAQDRAAETAAEIEYEDRGPRRAFGRGGLA